MMSRTLALLILLFCQSCWHINNNEVNHEIMNLIAEVPATNKSSSIRKNNDTRFLEIRIEETSLSQGTTIEGLSIHLGIMAYNIIDTLNAKEQFDEISVFISTREESKETNFSLQKIRDVMKAEESIGQFYKYLFNRKEEQLHQIIDTVKLGGSQNYDLVVKAFKKLKSCGEFKVYERTNIEITDNWIDFDTIVERENSIDSLTLTVDMESNLIISLDMKSSCRIEL